MQQDILNLNRTTKSILKNPDPKSSLAFTSGILRKDPSKVNTEGIGLNPNIPLEDEYIQNLQKQIHFMDLEIKLLKEKQAQDESLGGNYNFTKIGLKDGTPSIDHILTTTQKVKQLKLDTAKQINLLDQDLLQQQRENTVQRAKVANLTSHLEELSIKFKELLTTNMNALNENKTKLLAEKKGREETEHDINRIKAQLAGTLEENKKLHTEIDKKKLLDHLHAKKFEEDEKYDKEKSDLKEKFIEELFLEKTNLFMMIEKDSNLQRLRKENQDLQDKAALAEKKLSETLYEVLEYETRQQLSIKQKDEEIDVRRRLQEEYEKWKDQLEETVKNNELKVQKKLREAESADIKQKQAQLLREERELHELKTKFATIEETEKNYIMDEMNRLRHLETIKAKNEKDKLVIDDLDNKIKELDPDANNRKTVCQALILDIADAKADGAKLLTKVKQLEEENISLNKRLGFMQETIKLDEDMKKFDIENLKRVVNDNTNFNENITKFMEKWEYLKRLSKQDYSK